MDRATVDQLLTTTRTVRKRLDLRRPVEPAVIQECLELAIQAPNGGNQNRYHFVVVTDRVKRAAIGAICKKVFHQEHAPLSGAGDRGLPVYQQRSATQQNSASYLADHLGEVPVHIWQHLARGVVPDAGAALPGPRHGVDDASPLSREGGGGPARDPR